MRTHLGYWLLRNKLQSPASVDLQSQVGYPISDWMAPVTERKPQAPVWALCVDAVHRPVSVHTDRTTGQVFKR